MFDRLRRDVSAKVGLGSSGSDTPTLESATAAPPPVSARFSAPADRRFEWWWLLIPLILGLGWCMMQEEPRQAPARAPAEQALPRPEPAPQAEAPAPTPAPTLTPPAAAPVPQAAAPAPQPAAPEDAGKKLEQMAAAGTVDSQVLVETLNSATISFAFGSARITPASVANLEKAAAAIKLAPASTRIEVGGHTDNSGDAASNMRLSEARANAVVVTLTEMGVSTDMLIAKGYGDTMPKEPNTTAEGRIKNRRMEFSLQ